MAQTESQGADTRRSPLQDESRANARPPAVTLFDEQPAVGWRELLAALCLVVLSDVAIYRGGGFAGYAVLFVLAPGLLAFGAPAKRTDRSVWLALVMLLALAARLVWDGSGFLVAEGFLILVAFSVALHGIRPFVLSTLLFASTTLLAGARGLFQYVWQLRRYRPHLLSPVRGLAIALPALALLIFGTLFVLANPDLLRSVSSQLQAWATGLQRWLISSGPNPTEFVFWCAAAWISVGLLRPLAELILPAAAGDAATALPASKTAVDHWLYPAFRNTLIAVVALFAVYLGFEFQSLWFREFPEGFHYSGYAHQGAAWLTIALALATLVLSLIFQGDLLQEKRIRTLRLWARLWSLENLLLAVAVYNRLHIYVGFNGMTRMRVVGLFGITTVVVGFLLVLWKIARAHTFGWLIRRQLLALAVAVYLYTLLPVDVLVVRYNVRRIMAGDPAPSVQITEHPISAEGILLLEPLLDADNTIIREGVQAMLTIRHSESMEAAAERREDGWSAYQYAHWRTNRGLQRLNDAGRLDADVSDSEGVFERFREYAYQWY